MAVTREEIIEALKEMSLLEASELVKDCLLYTSPSPRD